MAELRLVEDALARGDDVVGAALVHVDEMQQRKADVVVLVVVPVDERAHGLTSVLERRELARHVGPVLEHAEVRLRVPVVVRCVRSAVLLAMPRSRQSCAIDLATIGEPRSLWMLSCRGRWTGHGSTPR
jgi:hypothetical protein